MRWFGKKADDGVVGPTVVCAVVDARQRADAHKAGLIISIADPELRAKTGTRLSGWRGRVCRLDFHDIGRPAPDMVMAGPADIEIVWPVHGPGTPDHR